MLWWLINSLFCLLMNFVVIITANVDSLTTAHQVNKDLPGSFASYVCMENWVCQFETSGSKRLHQKAEIKNIVLSNSYVILSIVTRNIDKGFADLLDLLKFVIIQSSCQLGPLFFRFLGFYTILYIMPSQQVIIQYNSQLK